MMLFTPGSSCQLKNNCSRKQPRIASDFSQESARKSPKTMAFRPLLTTIRTRAAKPHISRISAKSLAKDHRLFQLDTIRPLIEVQGQKTEVLPQVSVKSTSTTAGRNWRNTVVGEQARQRIVG